MIVQKDKGAAFRIPFKTEAVGSLWIVFLYSQPTKIDDRFSI